MFWVLGGVGEYVRVLLGLRMSVKTVEPLLSPTFVKFDGFKCGEG